MGNESVTQKDKLSFISFIPLVGLLWEAAAGAGGPIDKASHIFLFTMYHFFTPCILLLFR